jgi:hypothetical protein
MCARRRVQSVTAIKRIVGYILLFLLSLVPACVAYVYEAGANEVGMIYVGTLIWASIAWFALRLIEANEEIV